MSEVVNLDINMMAFYFLAGLSTISALMIVFSRNIIRSVFLLVMVFMGVAGIYMVTNAEFVAVTQILVYVGGILILLMFGIMLTNRIEGQQLRSGHKRLIPGIAVSLGLLWLLFNSIYQNSGAYFEHTTQVSDLSNTETIGVNLMTDQVIALEITAILLLVALVGAAFLVGKKGKTIE